MNKKLLAFVEKITIWFWSLLLSTLFAVAIVAILANYGQEK